MNLWDKCHFLHRAWRYRLISEKFGVQYLLKLKLTGKICIDIGANRGIFSYWMHQKIGPNGKVIAFEPQEELNTKLKELRTSFRLSQLEIAGIGLSCRKQTLRMIRPINHWGGASVENTGSLGESEEFDIKLIKLDSYLNQESRKRIGFIKCDVEGHELDVIQGAVNSIKASAPKILIECHGAVNENCDTFDLLESLNYKGFFFHEGGLCANENYLKYRNSGLIHRKAMTDFVFIPNTN
jgi:FkbM family methyltransferase